MKLPILRHALNEVTLNIYCRSSFKSLVRRGWALLFVYTAFTKGNIYKLSGLAALGRGKRVLQPTGDGGAVYAGGHTHQNRPRHQSQSPTLSNLPIRPLFPGCEVSPRNKFCNHEK